MRKLFLILLSCTLFLSSCEFVTKAPEEGNLNYLIVSQNYTHNTSVSSLNCCIADGISMELVLRQCAADSGRTIGRGMLLTDEDANLHVSDMSGGINALASSATSKDLTIIFYSGHGIYVDVKSLPSRASLLGALVFSGSPTQGTAYDLYTAGDILADINTIPGKKLLILDSCYSGKVVDLYGVTGTAGMDKDLWDIYFNDASYGLSDLFLFTAATSATESKERTDLGHGYFTYGVLKSLGWQSDTEIGKPTILRNGYVMLDALRDAAGTIASSYNSGQVATVNGTSDNMVLFDYN